MAKSKYDDEKYIGFTSGKLTVVEVGLRNDHYAGAIWRCRCSCDGNIKEYRASMIYNKLTKSCGCEQINIKGAKFNNKEYIGKIYGDLRVVEIANSEKIGVYWKCECIHCHNITLRKAQEVLAGKTVRCRNKSCIRDRKLTNIKYNKDDYLGKEYNLLRVERYFIEEYNGHDVVMWECKCLNCGSIIKLPASKVANGCYVSCGCLHASKHEVMIENILKKNNIVYKREVSFDDLIGVGGGKPRFDFELIDSRGNKKLIEYDGRQHFMESFITSTWNTERTLQNDKIKNNYCKDKGIELVRISQTFNNTDELENYMKINNII